MRVGIVDDSRLARVELKEQLQASGMDVEVVGEADSVATALALLSRETIDLLLLDIDLPDGNGFDVLTHAAQVPQVIFVTAFNEYAIQSFEFNALDYLMKPVRIERLKKALAKVQTGEESPLSQEQRIFIKDRDRCFFVSIKDVLAFEAMGNYTRVHLKNAVPSVYRALSNIEERIDATLFFRANRSWLVNSQFIEHIEPAVSGGFDVKLSNGTEVAISKRQAADFKRKWSL